MSIQHKGLAAGRWSTLPLCEQMAHIGGEVERALNWRSKNNEDYSRRAWERALELCDLALDDAKGRGRLKELCRLREALVDYFHGSNEFGSSEASWRKYFLPFVFAARRRH